MGALQGEIGGPNALGGAGPAEAPVATVLACALVDGAGSRRASVCRELARGINHGKFSVRMLVPIACGNVCRG